ncbi:MAG: hypothetical protein PF692_03465 [Kiritimatiellae bacterium]|jgi:NDP-sugar pyrophosphorylase family protein|nr:hypothetical protein [Kiritimatiellia bacterium]
MINFIEADSSVIQHCEPITASMDISDVQVAGSTFRELQLLSYEQALELSGVSEDIEIFCMENALVSPDSLIKLFKSEQSTAILKNEEVVAYKGHGGADAQCSVIEATEADYLIKYSWDFLKVNETLIADIETEINGKIHASAVVDGKIIVGEGTRILPGVYIEGNAIFGDNCKIGPNCYIRGNTFIGDNCHIGQSVEIKNCIIMNGSSIGHLSYCGDSIIAQKVNFGAGTTTSNLRHDGKNHRSMIDGELVDTGRRKMGMIIGANVHTGINTSFYPGRKIWPEMSTRPGDVVQKDLKEG